jgi:hypothetical protein
MEDVTLTLDEAIRAKDIKTIRNILTTSMVQDPGFSNGVFEERLKRCFFAGLAESDIFVPFDGKPLDYNQSAWTKDYYAEQRTEFRYNFSCERLEHLRKVGSKLYRSTEAPDSSYHEEAKEKYGDGEPYPRPRQKQSFESQGDEFPKWLIPAGIGVGVAALLLWILFKGKGK